METAAANIRAYAEAQMPREWSAQLEPGLQLGQIVRPLDTVAAYIPAGRYPLPSTLMMTVIPAQVAGVPNICVACSAARSPKSSARRDLLGVHQVFQMGGAQAIAAFAFGTRTVPRADRIVGPGNIYVAAAKKLLAGEVGIDFVAGPTEILIIAADGDPRHSRRRHAGAGRARCRCLGHPAHHLEAPGQRGRQGNRAPACRLCRPPPSRAKSIAKNSAIILVRSLDEAVELSNRFAPEHLSIPDDALLAESPPRRQRLRRPVQSRSRRRLRLRPQSRPAHQRRGAHARRPLGHRLSESDLRPGTDREPPCASWRPPSPRWRAPKAWKPTRAPSRCARAQWPRAASANCPKAPSSRAPPSSRMAPYSPPTGGRADKLRLDFNENTVGCSPRSSKLLKRPPRRRPISPSIPNTATPKQALARYFRVAPDQFVFTNGTDEAIQVFINTYVDDGEEVLVLKPAYAMYRFYAEVAGAKIVESRLPAARDGVPAAGTARRDHARHPRLLIANPNNPTGTGLGLLAIERILSARRRPPS